MRDYQLVLKIIKYRRFYKTLVDLLIIDMECISVYFTIPPGPEGDEGAAGLITQ